METPDRRATWRTHLLGAGLALLFLLVYFVAIRPARVAWAGYLAMPAVARTYEAAGELRQLGPTVAITSGSGRGEQHTAPAGLPFLFAGAVLLAAQPRKPWWAYLLGYHVVVGALALGLFVLGASGHPIAFLLQRFVATFLLDVMSLLAALLLVVRPAARPAARTP